MSTNMAPSSLKPCRAPFDGVVVHFSGAVFPCDQLSQDHLQKNMQIGNIHDSSLRDIFYSGEEIQSIRSRLLKGETKNLLCHTCDKAHTCNLYGDPNTGQEGDLLHGGAELDISYDNPKISRLELAITDLCNMKCTMCSLSRGEASPSYTPKNGFMDLQSIKNIIDQTVEISNSHRILLTLHWIGEPLIHPDIIAILEHISRYPVLNLHLVTNGIALRPQITDILLQMQGTLNVSLNARYPSTFAIVNQSTRYEEVHKNLFHFLEKREQRNKQSDWAVIVSSVVLAENYQEIPEFIAFWRNHFEKMSETPSISLNGKGEQSATQIMILQEIELPKSDVYFREALRQSDTVFSDIVLEKYRYYDQILLHHDDALDVELLRQIPVQDRSLCATKLIEFLGFKGELLPYVNLEEPHTRQTLEIHVCNKLIDISNMPVSFQPILEKYWNPLLLCLTFPKHASHYLRELTVDHLHMQPNALDIVGDIIRQNRALQNYIRIEAKEIYENNAWHTEDRQMLCFLLGLGTHITSLSNHRIEWLCGILSEIDTPDLYLSVHFSIPSVWSFYLSLFDSNNSSKREVTVFETLTDIPPDWIIRAIRRRILFGQIPLQPIPSKNRAILRNEEFQLLTILLRKDVEELESFLHRQMKQRQRSSERWFDILEILHHIGLNVSQEMQKMAFDFARCPLLTRTPQSKLALFLIAQVDLNTFFAFFQSSIKEFTSWQVQLGNEYIRNNV